MNARGRLQALRRGFALEVVTVAWNLIECVVAAISGLHAGSVVLLGYGFDALVETASSAVVGLRLRKELRGMDAAALQIAERRAARTAGAFLVLFAATILVESVRRLLGSGTHPQESLVGVVLTGFAAVTMPVLGGSKLLLARRLTSEALRIEAEQTIACAWFSLTTLGGLLLNAAFGWWWADPLAAIALVPWMVHEGLGAWRSPR